MRLLLLDSLVSGVTIGTGFGGGRSQRSTGREGRTGQDRCAPVTSTDKSATGSTSSLALV